MKHPNLIKRIVCIVLVLVMLLCMVACDDTGSRRSTRRSKKTTASTQSTQSTQSTRPTVYPSDQEQESYELEYTLTQADIDRFYTLLEDCETITMSGDDSNTIRSAVEQMESAYYRISNQSNTAMVLHYSRSNDKTLEQQYLDSREAAMDAYDAYLQMCRRIYAADCPGKAVFFDEWEQADIERMLAHDQKATQLQQRNVELGVEYRAATSDSQKIELYVELVQNNNSIAQIYGYDNYYEYAFEMVYERDYDAEAVEMLRRYAREYLSELMTVAEINFQDSLDDLNDDAYYRIQDFLYDDFDTLDENYVMQYINAVPSSLSQAMQTMLNRDSIFPNYYDSEEAAFTIDLGNRPYCYFGPDYANSNTIVHEGGHYYAALYSEMDDIPLDLAEVHSQANEWLFIQFLKDNMNSKEYRAVVDYMLYESIGMLIVCLMVDEFEQRVYTSDVSDFTASDFDAIMAAVELQYSVSSLTDMNRYWRLVVVEQPVYYISYAVSGIAALSLYTVAEEDWDEAMTIYQSLCECFDEDAGFLGNLRNAGLHTPFDEAFYVSLTELVYSRNRSSI